MLPGRTIGFAPYCLATSKIPGSSEDTQTEEICSDSLACSIDQAISGFPQKVFSC